MARRSGALLIAIVLVVCSIAEAADSTAVGTWKLTFLSEEGPQTYWIVKLEQKDSKWKGSIVSTISDELPKASVENLSVKDDRVRFDVKLENGLEFNFEGKAPKEAGKKLQGSWAMRGGMVPAFLEPTTLTSLDQYEMDKDLVANSKEGSVEVIEAAFRLLQQAKKKKADEKDVRAWAAKAFKTAEANGPRWQRFIGTKVADILNTDHAPIAAEYARQSYRLLEPTDEAIAHIQALEALLPILKKAKKDDEVKEMESQMAKLIARDADEYKKKMLLYKPEPFGARKGKSDRAVLVELFTGAQCPPCVAADLAFDGLEKTYKPADVILLQYHLHIPRPDALANGDSDERSKFYDEEVQQSTPQMILNGMKAKSDIGGSAKNAEERYKELRKEIEPLLEKATKVKLKATAIRTGDKLDIIAEASDIEAPGDKVRLRLALIEEQVRYAGTNGIRYHSHVVRALPGGPDGLALREKTGKQTVSVDLEDLRKKSNKYLDDYMRKNKSALPSEARPMDFKNLQLVAFVQDDETKEVLQAMQVEVKPKKE